jgi:hypothetical protein
MEMDLAEIRVPAVRVNKNDFYLCCVQIENVPVKILDSGKCHRTFHISILYFSDVGTVRE